MCLCKHVNTSDHLHVTICMCMFVFCYCHYVSSAILLFTPLLFASLTYYYHLPLPTPHLEADAFANNEKDH